MKAHKTLTLEFPPWFLHCVFSDGNSALVIPVGLPTLCSHNDMGPISDVPWNFWGVIPSVAIRPEIMDINGPFVQIMMLYTKSSQTFLLRLAYSGQFFKRDH